MSKNTPERLAKVPQGRPLPHFHVAAGEGAPVHVRPAEPGAFGFQAFGGVSAGLCLGAPRHVRCPLWPGGWGEALSLIHI